MSKELNILLLINHAKSVSSRHAPKILTLGAYGYQALAALALVFATAHLLPSEEYKRFSLSFATAQFAAIGAFEWVRIAATRFYPGPNPDRAPLQMANLGAAFMGAACLGALVALIALAFGAPAQVVVMSAGLAIGQGVTDLHFTLIRFRGDLSSFSRLQSLRATLLLAGGMGGAWLGGTALGALAGLCAAYAATVTCAVAMDKALRHAPWRSPSLALFKDHIAYGVPAAGASILYLGTVLAARYAVSLVAPGAAAGVLLAFDLFQRPFAVVTTAFHAILYPPVVAAYDRGGFAAARKPLQRLYGVEIACILLLAAFLAIAFTLPPVLALVAPDRLTTAFLHATPWAIITFASRAILLSTAPVTLHLRKRSVTALSLMLTDGILFASILLIIRHNTEYYSHINIIQSLLASSVISIFATCFALHLKCSIK